MTTYLEATTARTVAQIRAYNLRIAADVLGVNVAGFDDTSPQRALFECDARALAAEESTRVQLAKAGFITTAALAGDDFFDEALTWFDLTRIPASKAVWTLNISCVTTAGPYSLTTAAGELVAQADDGTMFESTPIASTTIASGADTLVRFTAMATGTSGNQVPGNINHLVIGRPGLSVSNLSPATQDTVARNAETSTEATRRAIGRWSTLGAGWTRASFDYLIPTIVESITKWRVRDDNPNGPGTIEVVASNSAGPSSPTENAALLAGIAAPDVMTLGTGGLSVISSTSKLVTITGTLYGTGANASLLTNAKDALDTLRAAYPLGGDEDGYLRLALLIEVIMGGAVSDYGIDGFSGAKNLVLSTPAADTLFAIDDDLAFDYTGLVLG